MMHPATNKNVTAPRNARLHLFESNDKQFLLDVEQGEIHQIDSAMARAMSISMDFGDQSRLSLMSSLLGISQEKVVEPAPPTSAPVRAFSLAIAQKCNLGCTYCYAEQGTFGGLPNNMDPEVARASVDRLLTETPSGEQITLAFMGGEPLFNRATLHAVTHYAAEKAQLANVGISFAITTNGTLIREEDVELFQQYRFTVTLSLDGIEETNDLLRAYRSGKGSFQKVKEKLQLLLATPQRAFAILARVTVTPQNLELQRTMRGLLELGFDSVKFSPMLKSPNGKSEMQTKDFEQLLQQMIDCGEDFRSGLKEGKLYPVSNIISTLKRIHRFQREQYPCGAGGGYMGVSAEGGLYACHRFVNDEEGQMGDVKDGVDAEKQAQWLKGRHLSAQGACKSCWARYMCSGSCHHEVIHRGRPACDYIRGWLHYCLSLYTDIKYNQPELLELLLVENPELTSVHLDG